MQQNNVLAHGIDLVEIESMRALVESPMSAQLGRLFTDAEFAAAGLGERRLEKLSGRLAVKEAVMKALGTGFGEGISFLDIEVINLDGGAPAAVLHGKAQNLADTLGIRSWLVSTSHTKSLAIASVIALG